MSRTIRRKHILIQSPRYSTVKPRTVGGLVRDSQSNLTQQEKWNQRKFLFGETKHSNHRSPNRKDYRAPYEKQYRSQVKLQISKFIRGVQDDVFIDTKPQTARCDFGWW